MGRLAAGMVAGEGSTGCGGGTGAEDLAEVGCFFLHLQFPLFFRFRPVIQVSILPTLPIIDTSIIDPPLAFLSRFFYSFF